MLAQLVERRAHLLGGGVRRDQLFCALLVDDARLFPLLVARVFHVAEYEDELLFFTGSERHFQAVRRDRRPTTGDRVLRLACDRYVRFAEAVVQTDERFAIGVEARDRCVDMVEGEVVATFAILRLVIDGAADDFHFAGAEIALQVGAVVRRVPKAELDEREQLDLLGARAFVLERDLMHFAGLATDGHEVEHFGAQAVAGTRDLRVAEAVTALVEAEFLLHRHERGRPAVPAVVDVEVAAAGIRRHVVVAIARQTTHLRVTVEAVPAALVRNEPEELLATQVVDPRVRGLGCRDDVFFTGVVEVTKAHDRSAPRWIAILENRSLDGGSARER